MKKLWIALMACLCVLSFTACGDNKPANDTDTPTETEAPAQPPTEEKTEEAPFSAPAEKMQIVGTEDFGYVSVPENWLEFREINGGNDFQYSDRSGTSIVTLNIVSTEGLTEEQKALLTAKTAAQSVWMGLESNGVTDIVGAQVQLKGHDAFQVYGAYQLEDGSPAVIVCWLFEAEDGVIHYVAAEGPVQNITTIVGYVEDSFSLTKPE